MVGNFFHQRGLSSSVLTDHTIAAVFLHFQNCVFQQQLASTVHQEKAFHTQKGLRVIVSSTTCRIECFAHCCPGSSFSNGSKINTSNILRVMFVCTFQLHGNLRSNLRSGSLL